MIKRKVFMAVKKVLIVDDEPKIIEILESFFEMEGYSVVSAHNGKEALKILKGNTPVDLVIADEKMPVMNGAEFLRRLRNSDKGIPVIILTGSLNAKEIKELDRDLYEHMMIKPVRLSELSEVAGELLGKKVRRG
jgi:CheY-like chemotaxis protein